MYSCVLLCALIAVAQSRSFFAVKNRQRASDNGEIQLEYGDVDQRCVTETTFAAASQCPFPENSPSLDPTCSQLQPILDCLYPLVVAQCGEEAANESLCDRVIDWAEPKGCAGQFACPPGSAPIVDIPPPEQLTTTDEPARPTPTEPTIDPEINNKDIRCIVSVSQQNHCGNSMVTSQTGPSCAQIQSALDCLYPGVAETCGLKLANGYLCQSFQNSAKLQGCDDDAIVCPPRRSPSTAAQPSTTATPETEEDYPIE